MLAWLEDNWNRKRWQGLRRVRVIHGKGEVLGRALRNWCDAKGISWAPESGNPGATIIHPTSKTPRPASRARLNRPAQPARAERPPDPADVELFEKAIMELERGNDD
jgi:hypothetical protein